LLLVILGLSGCKTLQPLIQKNPESLDKEVFNNYLCAPVTFKSVYFKKVAARFEIDEDIYDARVSIYYRSDSLLFFSVTTSGFEFFRGLVDKEGFILINRVEKMVIQGGLEDLGLTIDDIFAFFDKSYLCNTSLFFDVEDQKFIVDLSQAFMVKKYIFSAGTNKLYRAELFDSKRNSYLLVDKNSEERTILYYKFRNFEGKVFFTPVEPEFDLSLDLDMAYSEKYEIIQW